MENVYESFHTCVTASLDYTSVPKRFTSKLHSLFLSSPSDFSRAFENVFLQLCLSFHKDPFAERGLKTLLSFFSNVQTPSDTFLSTLFTFYDLVLQGCDSKDKTPRYACVWTLDHLLSLTIPLELPSKLSKKVKKAAEYLIRDKCCSVRFHAVNIFKSLGLVTEIQQALNSESNKEIRKHMMRSLKLDKNVTKSVCKKLKDVDSDVRLMACRVLRTEGDWKYCKEVLRLIVTDRNQAVREEALSIVKGFVKEKGLIQLGKSFVLEPLGIKKQNEVLAGMKFVCKHAAEKSLLADTVRTLICKIQELTLEELLMLRYTCESLKEKDENLLFSLMPSVENLGIEFVHPEFPWWYTQNLVKIGLCLDLGDETIRFRLLKSLLQLCLEYPVDSADYKETVQIQEMYLKTGAEDFLATTVQDVFFTVVGCVRDLFKDTEAEFSRVLIETINQAREPLDNPDVVDETLFNKKSRLEQALKTAQEYEFALEEVKVPKTKTKRQDPKSQPRETAQIQEELQETKTQICSILQRSLILSCELLRLIRPESVNSETSEIIKTLIYPSLQFEETYIKSLAIECLGLYCLNSPQACMEYLYIFKIILQSTKVGVLETVTLRAVFDFYMVYSFKDSAESDFSVSGTYLLDLISEYLDSPNPYMRAITVEGLCKLLVLCRSSRADIVAKLLIMFFNTQSSDQIKQCLLVFFTHYPMVSPTNALTLAKAFYLSVSAISGNINKQIQGIDLNSVNLNKMFSFIFSYLDSEYLKTHAKFEVKKNLHFVLFYWIAKELVKNPKGAEGKNYAKFVVQANFLTFTVMESCVAFQVIKKLMGCAGDKGTLNALKKVADGIEKNVERVGRDCREVIEKYDGEYEMVCEEMEKFLKSFPKDFDGEETQGIEHFEAQPKKRKCLDIY